MMSGMMGGEMMNGGMMDGMLGGMGWPYVGFILQIALLILIVLAAIYLTRLIWGGGRSQNNPLEALKLRYASGEIDSKEYQRMKKDLEA